MDANNPVIEIKNLDVFQRNALVLSNVNLSVEAGEFVYLIGKTGTGKSSLLRTLYADIPIKKGQVRVGKYNLENIKRKEIPYLRRQLGVVFQDFQLLMDRSVRENLAFVLKATDWKQKDKIEARIEDVLEKVGLSRQINKMPYQLSGGEQQRLSIARALLNQPEIILADEPTGNLDPETSEGIMKLLLDISKSGCAVLLATHDFIMISKFPSRLLLCEGGKISDENL